MATSGRRLALGVVCLALACTFGCTSASGGTHDGAASTKASPSATPSGPPTASRRPTGPPVKKSGDFCQVKRPGAWADAEAKRQYQSSAGLDRRGTAVNSSGDTIFAVDARKGRNELVRLESGGRSRHVVHSLNPMAGGKKLQYGSMRFDGRWLIFEVDYDAENMNDWEIYAWDSTADNAPFKLARHDKSIPGPFLFAYVKDGKAAWTEGAKGGKKEIHLFDLAGRKDSVVHTGQVSPVFLAGDLLGWREASSAKAPVFLKAVSIRTGKPAQLPPVVAAVRGSAYVTSDGSTWAWVDAEYSTLYAWKPGWKESATIAKAAEGENIDQMELAGDLITWVGGKAIWAADLRSHSRTTLTPEYGTTLSNGDALLVTYMKGGFTKDPSKRRGTTSYVLKVPELPPLAECATWTSVPQPGATA
ncbi:hypothetical protein [Streptomyces sp. NPDC050738]|uniref:hypothetical protein n=1 Tax=Streptomyces sp. NPDC050738 TaxID=3154744 RepID=UPI00341B9250